MLSIYVKLWKIMVILLILYIYVYMYVVYWIFSGMDEILWCIE